MPNKQNNNTNQTRRLTMAAAAAAIAGICVMLTNFLPFTRFSLLLVAAVCYYVAFEKAGIVYGFLAVGASLLISYFSSPLSSAFILICVLFAPYSFAAYLCKKLYYTKINTMLIRVAVMACFANLVFFFCYLLAAFIDFDIMQLVGRLNYFVVTLIITVFILVFDLIFTQVTLRLSKMIK